MGKKFSQAKTSVDDGSKWEEELPFEMKDIRDIAKGDFKPIRLVGYVEPFMRFWIPTEASKAYDPYKTKCKMYPSVCVDFDSVEEEFRGNDCLYRKAHYEYVDSDTGETKFGRLKPTKNYVIFFIDRERQEERDGIPLKKKYQQKGQSDIQCATVPTAFAKAVQNVIELYAKKVKKTVDPTDPDEGYDIFFKFDPDAKAEAKYTCQLGDPSPLTKEEKKLCELIPESVNVFPKDSPEKIKESLARHGYIIVERGEDPAEVAAAGSKKTRKSKGTMKAGATLLDDDEDEKPRKASKPAVEDDDDFDDESGDLDLDGDDTPAASSDDDDDFNFDDDDDEAPAKKEKPKAEKAKAEKPKPAAAESDDDDDDFDWDDDE